MNEACDNFLKKLTKCDMNKNDPQILSYDFVENNFVFRDYHSTLQLQMSHNKNMGINYYYNENQVSSRLIGCSGFSDKE
jgi:hypothetical protein